jgi:DegV family protein with EDD domain
MSKYVILSDSCCDLPPELAKKLGIETVPLIVNFNNVEYRNFLDEHELHLSVFYKGLMKGYPAFTSAANADSFINLMTPNLENGKDILYIGLSSKLSATYQNACIAAEELKEKYPERTIICIDSRCASLGEGLLLFLASKAMEEGKTIHELKEYVIETIPHICHWVTVDDLKFLKRGGRISAATASFGSILHIKPILCVNNEGSIVSTEKVRGRGASIRTLSHKVKDYAINICEQTVMICHADCREDAEYLAGMIRDTLKPKDIVINSIGPVVGAHGGPGALAVFFVGTKR